MAKIVCLGRLLVYILHVLFFLSNYSRCILTVLGVMYRSISVEVIRYVPQVQCHDDRRSAPPSYYSCSEVLNGMQWSESLTTFGLPFQVRLLRGP